jgi:hypothetical protein
MRGATRYAACIVATVTAIATAQTRPVLEPPVTEGRWIRPAATTAPAAPIWGHADGLRVGLPPLPGPRGLLRIYTPYVGQVEPKMINFIAVEPTPEGDRHRGLSELEHSKLDDRQGKRFWSMDKPGEPTPLATDQPARGVIETVDGAEHLTHYVGVERFDNGAHVYLRVRFRADRPHEVGIAVFAHADSKPLRQCVVSATMGNYARLRQIHLADRVLNSKSIWPSHAGDGFTDHARFPLAELQRTATGDAFVSATPDEPRPHDATYAPGTRRHWQFSGTPARQSWRMPSPPAGLHASVNGRAMYWASRSPIPGGVSFENFELTAPFGQGQEFWFAVEPLRDDDPAAATTRPTQAQAN